MRVLLDTNIIIAHVHDEVPLPDWGTHFAVSVITGLLQNERAALRATFRANHASRNRAILEVLRGFEKRGAAEKAPKGCDEVKTIILQQAHYGGRGAALPEGHRARYSKN